ncbi:hypothetical protein DAPPUDRAFT_235137 [Daphnia pulex]|uniref:Uncharacterized protein n=1 Tax=Daphnia pulex TaxID=6669 RepID=E9FYB5_DAPPU|nr:hypothetical protein DAPPUDRAFT_235137 [Daphnia pulex]|eukprot:EFX87799.1 hypothetical protein DAPPUDRAFT_235137 [Daphnia pulex]
MNSKAFNVTAVLVASNVREIPFVLTCITNQYQKCEGKRRDIHTRSTEKNLVDKKGDPSPPSFAPVLLLARWLAAVLSLQPSSQQQQQLLAMHCDVVAVALGVRSSLPSYAFLVTLQVSHTAGYRFHKLPMQMAWKI